MSDQAMSDQTKTFRMQVTNGRSWGDLPFSMGLTDVDLGERERHVIHLDLAS